MLDNEKRRNMDIKSLFDRDMMNERTTRNNLERVLKSTRQRSCSLKDEIKRQKALDQLKKTGRESDQVKDKNTQLKAENASENTNLDNRIAEAEKLKDRLKQLLDNEKRRVMDIKNRFDKDTMNLLNRNEQHETTLREFKGNTAKKLVLGRMNSRD
nr:unnamed protein product [Callosobruchus chinensis]